MVCGPVGKRSHTFQQQKYERNITYSDFTQIDPIDGNPSRYAHQKSSQAHLYVALSCTGMRNLYLLEKMHLITHSLNVSAEEAALGSVGKFC